MNRIFLLSSFLGVLFLLNACAASKQPVARNDPLIGKIFDSRSGIPIVYDQLIENISSKDVIYLSEKHDNPDQHLAQEKIIQSLVDKGLNPTIGFEFFSMEHTSHLLNFIDSGKVKHASKDEKFIEKDLRKKLGWDTQSDKMWGYYFSLLTLAKNNQLYVAGIDLNPALKKRITRKGIDGITPLEKEQIFSTDLDNNGYKEYMFSIFKAVHCGMGHGKMQQRLYDTWLARNDKMAHSISRLAEHTDGPVVIIVGGGHTEHELGVVDRLKSIIPAVSQVNVGLREISVRPAALEEYLVPLDLEGFDPVPPYDYLWFFQRVSYEDPCEEFKHLFKKSAD